MCGTTFWRGDENLENVFKKPFAEVKKWKKPLSISKNGFLETGLRFSSPLPPKFYAAHRNYEILSNSLVTKVYNISQYCYYKSRKK
jgi:hypothetical protein